MQDVAVERLGPLGSKLRLFQDRRHELFLGDAEECGAKQNVTVECFGLLGKELRLFESRGNEPFPCDTEECGGALKIAVERLRPL